MYMQCIQLTTHERYYIIHEIHNDGVTAAEGNGHTVVMDAGAEGVHTMEICLSVVYCI